LTASGVFGYKLATFSSFRPPLRRRGRSGLASEVDHRLQTFRMPPNRPDEQQSEQSVSAMRQRVQALLGGARNLPAWARANKLRAIAVIGACVVSVGGVVFGWLAIGSYRKAEEPVTLDMVMESLDLGAYEQTRRQAKQLRQNDDVSIDELSGLAFASGASAAYEADRSWEGSKQRPRLYLLAARYLEEARDRGFPPDREAEGLYLLGRSLYLAGKIPASRLVLLEALKINKQRETDIHGLLAGAYLNDANPDLERALAENRLFLSDPRLLPEVRHEGLLQRAQILLRLEKISECVATLDEIPDDAKNRAEAINLRGRVLMYEARALKNKPDATAEDLAQAQRKYRQAIKTLQYAQGHDTLRTQATRKAMYLIGVCYLEMGGQFQRAALEQFSRVRKLHAETPEGLMANFQEAELYRSMVGQDNEALKAYRRILDAVGDPESFSNPWITLDELRARMTVVNRYYLDTRNFEVSLQLTRHFCPLFSHERREELTAEVHAAWGRALLEQSSHLLADKAEPVRRLGRGQLRQAGKSYSKLAKLELITSRYPEHLWKSAENFLEGQDYRNTIRVLQEYLKNESRRRHAQALVYLGESLLALDRTDEALEALQECIEFHSRDATAFQARLLAGRAHIEKGDFKQAEALLQENLNGQYQTPDSKEWRDSLFALGNLFYIQDRFPDAIRRLEESVERYPDDPRTLRAKYLVANSYCQSAELARKELKRNLAGSARAVHTRQVRDFFNKALDGYREIQATLTSRQEADELSVLDKAMLRNCYFAVGRVLFQLGEYETAIKTYSTITFRYQNQPEVLLAYLRIANAYRRLDEPVKARSTLQQAKVVLQRMKTETTFNETTNYTRQEWSDLLNSLSKL